MTTKSETQEAKKKGAPPTHESFFTNEDGSVNYQSRIRVWTSKNGKAMNCTIKGKRAVIFAVRPKAQAGAQQGRARKRPFPFPLGKGHRMSKKMSALSLE